MCAQTHKVRVQGEWMTIEAFLWKRYGFKISHALCPEAATELIKTLVTETPDR